MVEAHHNFVVDDATCDKDIVVDTVAAVEGTINTVTGGKVVIR